jgi:SapC
MTTGKPDTKMSNEKKAAKARPAVNGKSETVAATPEASAPVSAAPAPATPAIAGLPPMYSGIEALSAKRHGALKLGAPRGFAHAAAMSSILVGASEIPAASRDYPVVFSDRENDAMAYAVTGYAEGVNVHVDSEGAWRKDQYIPAYVRRYPFIFLESEGGKRLTLGVDARALSPAGGVPLYEEDGKPAAAAKNALAFCTAYKKEMDRTRVLVQQIIASGITISRRAEVTLAGGQKAMIGGFRIVDEKKLAALPDEVFLELRRSGALTLVYCHLMSMASWRNILA